MKSCHEYDGFPEPIPPTTKGVSCVLHDTYGEYCKDCAIVELQVQLKEALEALDVACCPYGTSRNKEAVTRIRDMRED